MAQQLLLNDIVEVKFFCSAGGIQNGINVLHYKVSGVPVPGVTDSDAAAALSTQAAPLYKAYLPTGTRYEGVRLQIVRPGLFPAAVSVAGAGVGLIAQDRLPSQVAFLLSLRTGVAGRSGRGRVYLPFWPETYNSSTGRPEAVAVTAATNWSNAMIANLTVTVGAFSCVLSPVIMSKVGALATPIVTTVLIRQEWATQRRRSQINRPDVLGPTP